MSALLLFLLLLFHFRPLPCIGGPTLRLDFRHLSSDPVRRRLSRGGADAWPETGTAAYYAALAARDRGRVLAQEELTFVDGNETDRLAPLGFLHYAVVELGTPNVTFLVALDTGSHLFWVPCDCQQCAPTSSAAYGAGFEFNIYSPSFSSTSKSVPCNSHFCALQRECSTTINSCPYQVAYVSSGTSSSGVLVEDVLYLTAENSHSEAVEARIIFGCGMIQTGSFLESAAPNGLFGLGMDKSSVPSLLSNAGLTSDSFSMCFGRDGVGRISFGDKGGSDQNETPFHVNKAQPTYNVSINGIGIGNHSVNVGFTTLIDSGTSFTTLSEPAYTDLCGSFNAQVYDMRHVPDNSFPFEYCYNISSNETLNKVPQIVFTMESGSQFSVVDPIIVISFQQREYFYCLAVIKSHKLNIIGQNFMTGLRVIFDRERLVLGWRKSNCYDIEDSNPLHLSPRNSSASPPTKAVGPSSYTPEVTMVPGNATILKPTANHSAQAKSVSALTFLVLLMSFSMHFSLILADFNCSIFSLSFREASRLFY